MIQKFCISGETVTINYKVAEPINDKISVSKATRRNERTVNQGD